MKLNPVVKQFGGCKSKKWIMALGLLFYLESEGYAKTWSPQRFLCYDQVKKISPKIDETQWTQVFKSESKRIFRSPTKTWGRWIEVVTQNSRIHYMSIWTYPKVKRYQLSSTCHISPPQLVPLFPRKLPAKTRVTDSDLKKKIKNGDHLIYIWSPKFTYSFNQFHIAKNVVTKLGINLIVVASSDTHPSTLHASYIPKYMGPISQLKIHRSVELLARQSDLHLPTMWVAKKGGLVGDPLVGVYTSSALEYKIRLLLEAL